MGLYQFREILWRKAEFVGVEIYEPLLAVVSLYQIYKSLNNIALRGVIRALALVEMRYSTIVEHTYKVFDGLQAEWIFSIRCRAVENGEEEVSRREVVVVDVSNGVVV